MGTKKLFQPFVLIATFFAASSAFANAPASPPLHQERPPQLSKRGDNLLQNGSFENNWFNHEFSDRRRFLLLQASDMGIAESDGNIDCWMISGSGKGKRQGSAKSGVSDTTVARMGTHSLRFDGPGSASQLIRFAGENSPKGGGAHYAYFMPMEKTLAWQVLRRTVAVGAWCRTRNVPAGAEPKLTLKLECGARQRFDEFTSQVSFGKKIIQRSAAAAGGTHDWEYIEVRVEAAEMESAPWFATVTVSSGGKGTVWFDDVSCVEDATTGLANHPPRIDAGNGDPEPVTELVNRLPNGGFESLDESGWARGWNKPSLWTWFRNDYYSFTGWSHSDSKSFRGSAVVDRMISFGGNASLRMTVFPGDNFAVESAPMVLNQKSAHPIEVRAMVKADNLRTLEIMGRDERGAWLRQGDFLGDGMQEPGAYNMASTGSGTYDWVCVRKFFSPDHPIKSLSLSLAVRGFDGQIVHDKNIVGTVWIDDVQVFEHGVEKSKISTANIPAPLADAPAISPFKFVDINLGDRMWGKNAVSATFDIAAGDLERAKRAAMRVTLTDLQNRQTTTIGKAVVAPPSANPADSGIAMIQAPYEISILCKNSHEQYKLTLQLLDGEKPIGPPADFYFGTPEDVLSTGVSGSYFYRDEKPFAYVNLNVAHDSLQEISRCQLVVNTGGKEKTVLDVSDFSGIRKPQTAPEFINTRNMIRSEIASEGFTVHPWNDPQRDNVFKARLFTKAAGSEKIVAESGGINFGFIESLPPNISENIEKTAINEKGFITINGKPWFPVYWRPHGESKSPESNYPPHALGYKTLDLTEIACSKNGPPDADVKAALLAKIEKVKNDPKFFQYEIGDGEMQLQGREWVQRAEWCKTAIGWIREADPNHIINGPISWLVGHPGHDQAMKSFMNSWDVIGVESSFESPVLIDKIAVPLMTQRKTAVIVGLEAYFYQPLDVLRWRGYRAILDGAHGIGLCPSGMLESRPDSINYLRGLNAEFRALAPVIMGDEPAHKCSADSEHVDIMERAVEGKRYLIVARKNDNAQRAAVNFTLPTDLKVTTIKVLFEGRSILPVFGGFFDEFATPYGVHVYELQ